MKFPLPKRIHDKIFKEASQIRKELATLDYLKGLDISLKLTKPEYHISVDRQKAIDLGLSISDIGTTVKTMVGGTVATRYKDGAYYYPIRIMMDEQESNLRMPWKIFLYIRKQEQKYRLTLWQIL